MPIYFGDSVHLPHMHCPKCGRLCDAASRISSEKITDPRPDVGSLTFCIYCAAVLTFVTNEATVSGLSLQVASPEDVKIIMKDPMIQKAYKYTKMFAEMRKRNQD